MSDKLKVSILLLFNRSDTAKKVFAEVRNIRPAKLHIAVDGPRFLC